MIAHDIFTQRATKTRPSSTSAEPETGSLQTVGMLHIQHGRCATSHDKNNNSGGGVQSKQPPVVVVKDMIAHADT